MHRAARRRGGSPALARRPSSYPRSGVRSPIRIDRSIEAGSGAPVQRTSSVLLTPPSDEPSRLGITGQWEGIFEVRIVRNLKLVTKTENMFNVAN